MRNGIEFFAKEKLGREVAAGIDHFKRVYRISKKLAKLENMCCDDEVLHAACFLHDLFDESGDQHNIAAGRIAEEFLRSIGFPNEKIVKAKEAIKEHVPSGNPNSKEAILLHDADLIDFLGATGIVRLSIGAWNWMSKSSLEEFIGVFKKYRKDCSENLILNSSKQLAKNKIIFMDSAIKEIKKELDST